jgi:Family of unknown function (DUF5906)
MAKTLTELQKDFEDLQMDINAWKTAYNQSQNDNEKNKLRNKIDEAEGLAIEIEKQIAVLKQKEEKVEKKNKWKKEQPLIDQAMEDNYMGYLITEDKFIYCRDYGAGQSNVQFKTFPATRIIRALGKMAGITIHSKDYAEIIDYFEQQGKTFLDITSSFNRQKWNESEIYNKMSVIRAHWLEPNFVDTNYDPNIDVLITAVAGGKQENVEHLEKWVAFKYLYPEKNANTPNLDIGGNPGGNGKGRFVELLKTIFTSACVVQAHREELEKFNSNWEMATVLYYDEPEEKELAASKLKQATGSEDMRIEKKGIDATMADRNYNFVFLSNNEKGVVKLSGGSDGGEDRRYSVITTDLVLYDLLVNTGMDDKASRQWLDNLAQKLLKNKAEVAKWLGAIILKHDVVKMDVLPALHGEDYQTRFEEQKENIIEAFDRVMTIINKQGFMPTMVLCELIRILTENSKHLDKNIISKFEYYLKRNQITYRLKDRQHWDSVWHDEDIKAQQSKCFIIGGNPEFKFDMSEIYTSKNSAKIGSLVKDTCVLVR